MSMTRGAPIAYAGIAVLEAGALETVETATAVSQLRFPYVPGLPPSASFQPWSQHGRSSR